MMTEEFLSNTLRIIFAKKPRELDQKYFQDLNRLCSFYRNEMVGNGDIPIYIQAKFDLIQKICGIILNGGSTDAAIVSLTASEKFKQFADLMYFHTTETIDDAWLAPRKKFVHDLVAWCKLNRTYAKFQEYSDMVRCASFDSVEAMISDFNDLVKNAFQDVTDYELSSRSGLTSSINTKTDSVGSLVDEIRKKFSAKNLITSGIEELDNGFLGGGFQPSRLYMFSGTSGIGKSTILLNLALRGALSGCVTDPLADPFGFERFCYQTTERVFLYVTMENYVYETWIRLYCALFKKTKQETVAMILNRRTTAEQIRDEINQMLEPFNSSIQMDYFPANTISPATIAGLISKHNKEPGRRCVKAVYIDYLDLLEPDEKREFFRLDLGQITSRLKAISATFEIPIITATQLNREAYKKTKSGDIGGETISESMHKLFIADFSAIMMRDRDDEANKKDPEDDFPTKILLKVHKNRDGKTGDLNIYFDYPRSRFLTVRELNQEYMGILEAV
jgi:replicative DNA helicase